MTTTEAIRRYLEGVGYPASVQELLVAAHANGAPRIFVALLSLSPTAVEFRNPRRWRNGWSAQRVWCRTSSFREAPKEAATGLWQDLPRRLPLSMWRLFGVPGQVSRNIDRCPEYRLR